LDVLEHILHRLQKIESSLAAVNAKQDALNLHLGITQIALLKPEVMREINRVIEEAREEIARAG